MQNKFPYRNFTFLYESTSKHYMTLKTTRTLNRIFQTIVCISMLFILGQLSAQPLSGIQPKHNAFIESFQVSFEWNSMPNAVNYTITMAEDVNFTINMQQSPLLTGTNWTSNVLSVGVWYWKVSGFDGVVNSESEIRSFRIFQPNNLPGNTLWLAADSNVTNSGGVVSAWNDISGNGHVFGQSIPADQPILINNLPALNNQPVLRFDGASDYLNAGNVLNIGTNSFTSFYLAKGTGSYYAKFGSGAAPFNIYGCYNLGTEQGHELAGATYQTFPTTNATDYHVVSFIANRATSNGKLFRNFNQMVSNVTTGIPSASYNFTNTNPLLLGRYAMTGTPFYLNGDVAEVIFYNVALSDADRQLVQNHLIYKYAPPVDLGKDTLTANFCPINITAPAGYTNLLWSTGATTSSISAVSEGAYWLRGTNIFGVVSYDTIVVSHPEIHIPSITGICINDSVLWDTELGAGYTYLWSPNGETTSSIYITTPGTYSVQVTDAFMCTINSGNVTFTLDTYSQTAFLGNDTTLCSGNLIGLQIGASETVSYTWPDASTATQYAVDTTGNYFLESVNVNGCVAQDTLFVNIMGTAPDADFSFQNVCFGETANFVDESIPDGSDAIAIWNWDMGDGSPTLTDQNPSHDYTSEGVYLVELYVESVGGCGAYHTESINVFKKPIANFSFTGHCAGQEVQFNNSSLPGDAAITDYLWDFDMPWTGAYNNSIIPVPNRIFDQDGTYDVFLEVTDANGCSDTIVIPLVIDPTPEAEFLYTDVCVNTPLQFVNVSVTEPLSTYLWNFGDNTTSISSNPSKTYTFDGIETVTLEVTNTFGCVGMVQHNVEVFPAPVAIMDLGAYCMGTYMEVEDLSTVSVGNIDSSVWVFNTTDTLIGSIVSYLIPSLGQQQVQLTTYSNEGCSATISQFIQVNTALEASFVTGSVIAAAGYPVIFNNTSTSGTVALWNFGDGTFSSDFSPEHIYSDTYIDSTVSIYLVAMNLQGCIDTAFLDLSIELARIDLELTTLYLEEQNGWYIVGVKLTNRGSVNLEKADLVIESPMGLLFSETWTGTLFPLEDTIYVFTAQPGAEISEHDAKDAFLCVRGVGYDAFGIAETNLSNNQVCEDVEGENVILKPVYPNPATDEMNIQLIVSVDSEVSVQLIDARGREVLTIVPKQTIEAGLYEYKVNIEQIQSGTYFLRMLSGGMEMIQKVVVGD